MYRARAPCATVTVDLSWPALELEAENKTHAGMLTAEKMINDSLPFDLAKELQLVCVIVVVLCCVLCYGRYAKGSNGVDQRPVRKVGESR